MEHLINLINDVGHWGYLILFVVIFLESFPLTFFLPGDSLLFTTGFLASQGYFHLGFLVLVLYLAGITGYFVSYFFGKRIRDFIMNSGDRYWFKTKHIKYTENFYGKYGAKALIIGRFIPIVRSFSATLAGAVDMNFKSFTKYTVFGGVFWTGGVTSLGFYLGRLIPSAHLYLTPIVLGIIFISFIPTIVEYIKHRKKNA